MTRHELREMPTPDLTKRSLERMLAANCLQRYSDRSRQAELRVAFVGHALGRHLGSHGEAGDEQPDAPYCARWVFPATQTYLRLRDTLRDTKPKVADFVESQALLPTRSLHNHGLYHEMADRLVLAEDVEVPAGSRVRNLHPNSKHFVQWVVQGEVSMCGVPMLPMTQHLALAA